MPGGLPTMVDPVLLAQQGVRLTGSLVLHDMPRLRELMLDDNGQVTIDLNFFRTDGSGECWLHGLVQTQVRMICQRCLEPMVLVLKAAPQIRLLREEEPEREPTPEIESMTFAAPVALVDWMEEELLLTVPMVPMHALAECPARAYLASASTKPHPFAGLAHVKRGRGKFETNS